ncbi:MAG TPA: rhodanese-like domain-containing protein [Egibacteraceae bacterium]|nr:rhodanese-like domain-containing protein [Egibacteraceae bacterium]
MIEDLTPRDAAERLRDIEPPLLVDVRETWERELASIPGSLHIPMNQLPARLDELSEEREIIVYCHTGGRSLQAAMWLESQGYDRLANVDGGIDEWSQTIDHSIPRYQ